MHGPHSIHTQREQESPYTGPERRSEDSETVRHRIEMTQRVERVERAVEENTRLTGEIKKNTDAMVKVFKSLEGAKNVGSWAGKFSAWVAVVVIAISMVIFIFKTGTLPPPIKP